MSDVRINNLRYELELLTGDKVEIVLTDIWWNIYFYFNPDYLSINDIIEIIKKYGFTIAKYEFTFTYTANIIDLNVMGKISCIDTKED